MSAFARLLAVTLHLMIVTEEEHLSAVFGEEYLGYCERVPRYLGWGRWGAGSR